MPYHDVSHRRAACKRYHEENREKVSAQRKLYRAANRDKRLAQSKAWRLSNPEAVKINNQEAKFRLYGLTSIQYAELLNGQGGRCAICRQLPSKTKALGIDHDHVSRAVRGLLCDCDPRIVKRALSYLVEHAQQVIGAPKKAK